MHFLLRLFYSLMTVWSILLAYWQFSRDNLGYAVVDALFAAVFLAGLTRRCDDCPS